MVSKKYFLILLFFVFSLNFQTISRAETFSAVVTKVSDGDTIWVTKKDGQRIKIRIWGIDTPEKFWSRKLYRSARSCRTTTNKVKKLGFKSSWFAKKILYRKTVKIVTFGRGYYRRMLAKIILPDGEDYGLKIIKEGYSCVYRRNTDPEYIQAMRQAREEKKGLWSIDFNLMDCLCH